MTVSFSQGQTLSRGDLDLYLTNVGGTPANCFGISFAIFYVDPNGGAEVLIGSATRTPVNPAVGEYFAAIQIPANATAGDYRIRWTFKEHVGDADQTVVQEFSVVAISCDTSTTTYSTCVSDLISKLRFMTKDSRPDQTYHFRPPTGEGVVGCYSQVFGHIWNDDELYEFLEVALWKWNMMPPETENLSTVDALCSNKPVWRAVLLWGALVQMAQALAYQWSADEFDYSIGGISLSIEKSSKYMDLKRNAEEQWDKLTDAKVKTVLLQRGLRQPRFGRGVRSAFGPNVGRSVLSPRAFV